MTVKRPSALTFLTIALFVSLPALAVLQYRWVGQVSDAERERMMRNVRTASGQLRDAFDGELARAFLHLQVDAATLRASAWTTYAQRFSAWQQLAEHPGIVKDVLLADSDGASVRLRRWDPEAATFEPARWDGALAPLRAGLEQHLTAGGRSERLPHVPELLVAPVFSGNLHITQAPSGGRIERHERGGRIFGYTLIQLDLPFIRSQLLPTLVQRHFTHTDAEQYRVAVIERGQPGGVIYRSAADAPTDPARADVVEHFFGQYREPLMFFAREAEAPRPGDGTVERSVVVGVLRGEGQRRERIRARFTSDLTRWLLLVQHEDGSLEAAVGRVRMRNFGISTGILLLMSVVVGLLAASSRRAQRLARQQMEFVAGVSHELRTPVAVIRSAAENLSHGVVGDPARVRRYGETIEGEARRLGEMVERVLHFAGIESGRALAHVPVSIPAVVEDAIHGALPEGARSTIERHIAADLPPVLGDAAALRSAVENLVTNAVKYGGAEGWLAVRATLAPGGRDVRIAVEDRGLGIAAADLPHVFEPFYRGAEALNRQIQGSGLGLSLVKRIVEAHGGRVTVSTRERGGSTFTIHLPAAAPHRAGTLASGAQAEALP